MAKGIGLLLCTATLCTRVAAAELDAALQERLAQVSPTETVPVIIEFPSEASLDGLAALPRKRRRTELVQRLQAHARSAQAEVAAELISYRATTLWHVNAIAVPLPSFLIRALAARPDILRIRLDTQLTLEGQTIEASATPGWNLRVIGADRLWTSSHDGQGITVATLDSGVDPLHPDLGSNWRSGSNSWFDPQGEHAGPYDASGHGTQVLGLVVGASSSGTAIGVAPGAQWIAAKIFDDAGRATLSGIHAAFQWLLDPDGDPLVDDVPDVVIAAWNLLNSVGACEPEFEQDVQLLKLADIAVAFSAGNSGPWVATSASPANYPASLAAGAVDEQSTVADFSSRGPSACSGDTYPQLVAPGVAVYTADLTNGGLFPDSYVAVSGSSYAAAHLGGALALLRGAHRQASVVEVESALAATAVDVGAPGPDNDSGAGLLSLEMAEQWLAQSTPPDADGDGFDTEADCNDSDPEIYPGAPEVIGDGIDQDCNSYDLTIEVQEATWSPLGDKLKVVASSALGEGAALRVDGFGELKWQSRKGLWELSAGRVGGDPGSVTVSGIEGTVTVPTTASR